MAGALEYSAGERVVSSQPMERRIELYTWDSRGRMWSGPDEIAYSLKGSRRILDGLRELNGSWHGDLELKAPGLPSMKLFAYVRDLGDSCMATLDLEGMSGGPAEVLLVVPAERRAELRLEFAFEFTAFLRFLEGPVSQGTEQALHDGVDRILRDAAQETTIVISVETRFIASDVHILTAHACERLAMGMVAWAREEHAACAARESGNGRRRCPSHARLA